MELQFGCMHGKGIIDAVFALTECGGASCEWKRPAYGICLSGEHTIGCQDRNLKVYEKEGSTNDIFKNKRASGERKRPTYGFCRSGERTIGCRYMN